MINEAIIFNEKGDATHLRATNLAVGKNLCKGTKFQAI